MIFQGGEEGRVFSFKQENCYTTNLDKEEVMSLANITPVLKLFIRAQVKFDKSVDKSTLPTSKGLFHVIFHGMAVMCSHL